MRAGVPAPRTRPARRSRGRAASPVRWPRVASYSYGLSLAYLGDAKGEIKAFTGALAFTEGRGPRANLLYNRADAQGCRRAARGGHRRLPERDRSREPPRDHGARLLRARGRARPIQGDLPSAWVALESAHRVAPPFSGLPGADILDAPSVFFVPAYEKDYYRALSRMAQARVASSASERREHLARALEHWEVFIAAAERANDRYLENARLHAFACRRELEQKPR